MICCLEAIEPLAIDLLEHHVRLFGMGEFLQGRIHFQANKDGSISAGSRRALNRVGLSHLPRLFD